MRTALDAVAHVALSNQVSFSRAMGPGSRPWPLGEKYRSKQVSKEPDLPRRTVLDVPAAIQPSTLAADAFRIDGVLVPTLLPGSSRAESSVDSRETFTPFFALGPRSEEHLTRTSPNIESEGED